MKQSARSGFTLIELLVVIAIIAILAAILFPVFASAREKARQTTCASNEKQIAMAMLMYATDFDEYLPQDRPDYVDTSHYWSWDGVIAPYVKLGRPGTGGNSGINTNSGPLFTCPDDIGYHQFGGSPCQPRSYAMITDSTGQATSDGQLLNKIQDTEGTLLIAEMFTQNDCSGDYHSTNVNQPFDETYVPGGLPAHSGGWNYGFCDGHVKWYRPETTVGKPGVGTCAAGNGSVTRPCGMWTIDPND